MEARWEDGRPRPVSLSPCRASRSGGGGGGGRSTRAPPRRGKAWEAAEAPVAKPLGGGERAPERPAGLAAAGAPLGAAEAARSPRPDALSAPRGGLLDGPCCRSLCTARGACRLLEVLLCALLLACGSVSAGAVGGYTGLFSLGSVYYQHYGGAYSGFNGAAGEEAQRLDARFQQLRLPPARAAVALAGGLLAWAGLALGAGLLRLPGRCPAWLLAEALLDAAAALGLVAGLCCYYVRLGQVYASAECQERERLYRSKGYPGFDCRLHGAEIAAGLLAAGAVGAFAASAALAVRAFWTLRKHRAKPGELHV